ncbi:hypothetical protein NQ315_006840 [Exocentrus adspersus]|uniref:Carboxylesterase type B domain-containing protein n=1 Tax=Exocentrus adspersus TaxID=1586481 RepID=A0AAV8WCN0_9CUCU|nr:hypothetical protein NQ315_006840 [Exocentrus adspersus]
MNNILVTVQEGILRGRLLTDISGNLFYGFQGIPYAKPPLGKLRFKAPQPPDKWNGIRDATKEGNEPCAKRGDTVKGSEDCLFLNIFTKKITPKIQKPVMVWVHGGGFTNGSSHSQVYGPEYLIAQDIVLVTVNYRLGPFGFLCLEDSSLGITGNAGSKDVVMALKWVQNNIKEFCGDPKNVTVFGESCGGAIAHSLMFSPMAKGLFHKIIAQSGSAINALFYGKRSTAHLVGNVLGINGNNESKLLERLQKMPADELLLANGKVENPQYVIGKTRNYGLVIEKPSADEPAFLTEDPRALLKSENYEKVPLMLGVCNRDGMNIYGFIKRKGNGFTLKDESIVPLGLNIKQGTPLYDRVVKLVKEFYFKDKDPLEQNDQIFKLYTDNHLLVELHNYVVQHMQRNHFPMYFYKFSLDTSLNYAKAAFSLKDPGACHADDIFYLFNSPLYRGNKPLSSMEKLAVQRVTKMWANFAKYGNPTPDKYDDLLSADWKQVTQKKFHYLDIGGTLQVKTDPEKEAMDFWNSIKLISDAKL